MFFNHAAVAFLENFRQDSNLLPPPHQNKELYNHYTAEVAVVISYSKSSGLITCLTHTVTPAITETITVATSVQIKFPFNFFMRISSFYIR